MVLAASLSLLSLVGFLSSQGLPPISRSEGSENSYTTLSLIPFALLPFLIPHFLLPLCSSSLGGLYRCVSIPFHLWLSFEL